MAPTQHCGFAGAGRAWLIGELARHSGRVVILCPDQKATEELTLDLRLFIHDRAVLPLVAWDTLPLEPISPQVDCSASRLLALSALQRDPRALIVCSSEALLQFVPEPRLLAAGTRTVRLNDEITLDELASFLKAAGYRTVSLVEDVGDVALRGQVLDFFPPTTSEPVRVEFTNRQISRLSSFGSDDQRSTGEREAVTILPVREIRNLEVPERSDLIDAIKLRGRALETPPREIARATGAIRTESELPGREMLHSLLPGKFIPLRQYFGPEDTVVCCQATVIAQQLEATNAILLERTQRFRGEHFLHPPVENLYDSVEELAAWLQQRPQHQIDDLALTTTIESSPAPGTINTGSCLPLSDLSAAVKSRAGTGEALGPLRSKLDLWRSLDYRVGFVLGSPARIERLQRMLLTIGYDASPVSSAVNEWLSARDQPPLAIFQGQLSKGFQLSKHKFALIAEHEIFSERSHRHGRRKAASLKKILGTIAQLKEGDLVVHADYGIGRYHGLKHLAIEDATGDFLHIEYADSTLYLPVQNIGRVQKFSAAEGHQPELDKLGSTRWQRTRQKVRESVVTLAGDLIKLYAERSVVKGWRFEPWGAEDERFADDFAYDETQDQLQAIQDTIADLAKDRPMDRLVCGDVGFGKTEVAIRAAFKCCQHARQVVVLVPTTILAEQHKNSFVSRFMGHPARIGAVSRFYPAAENKETLRKLAAGELDVIIGTHRLLSRDVVFSDLGLVIIDEEHRFGVKQKERLKRLKKQVDVLTLTATPIPRTLHMSLLGIRDISVISTPPHNRKLIRTYVAAQSDTLIRDAILRELQHGGQVFFVHNRVESIELITAHLAELVPEARFVFAHGQMAEGVLEGIMHRFVRREFEVLVATTIIESGIDLPNANTIIIDRAHTFGLAQLYQLRGRVGRGDAQAYCYFLVPALRQLSVDAQERLKALQSLDDLGLGFNLAVRDLEIRGAGNLLGKEQSGHVLAVGFELYMRILKEAVLNLKGETLPLEEEIDPEVKLGLDSFIPNSYVPDVQERLILYQRLSSIRSQADAQEMYDEFLDRFGPPGKEVENLLELMSLRALFRSYGVIKAELVLDTLRLVLSPRAHVDPQRIFDLIRRFPDRLKFTKNLTLSWKLTTLPIETPGALYQPVIDLFAQIQRQDVAA